jgi:hypothetical protein
MEQKKEKLTFKQKLERVVELEQKIQDVVKPIYEEWNELSAEVVPEFIAKSGANISGLLISPLTIRFKDGSTYQLRPEYVSKEGYFKNVVWKAAGPAVFSIHKIVKDKK